MSNFVLMKIAFGNQRWRRYNVSRTRTNTNNNVKAIEIHVGEDDELFCPKDLDESRQIKDEFDISFHEGGDIKSKRHPGDCTDKRID